MPLSSVAVTFLPDPAVPARGRLAVYAVRDAEVDLAGAAGALGLPAGKQVRIRVARPRDAEVVLTDVPARALDLAAAVPALCQPSQDGEPDTLRVWRLAVALGVRLVRSHRIAPALLEVDGEVVAAWRALVTGDPEGQGILARLAAACPRAAHAVALDDDRVWDADELLVSFLDAIADLAARRPVSSNRSRPPRARVLPWTARWAEALTDPSDPVVPLRDDAQELVAGVGTWLAGGADARGGVSELRLHAPADNDDPWRLTFAVRADDGALLDAGSVWRRVAEAPDDVEAGALQEALLHGLGQAARVFPPVDAALRQSAPEGVDLDLEQAWTFLHDVAPVLDDAGILVTLPPEIVEQQLTVRLRIGDAEQAGPPRESQEAGDAPEPSPLSGGSLFAGLLTRFRWERAVGDVALTDEEFAELVAAKAPLVRWRDQWVRVDPERVDRLAALPAPGELPLADALALALAGAVDEPEAWSDEAPGWDEPVEVVSDGAVAGLVERIRGAGERVEVGPTPPGFCGQLRPYQQRGVAWLQGMSALGLGAVLADAMGLGKTPQLIAHLLLSGGDGPHLVVCPTSVVGNWEREVRRFAPELAVTRYHGPERPEDLTGARGVVLTSYGMLRREVERLAGVEWDTVTLDEAQHVKNPATAGARAVRRLDSRQTLALTGTPLENRLAELWSLLDATNPGLLGSRARFGRRFVGPVEQHRDAGAARRLRRLVSPFILRRDKTDPEVAPDLPDKIERTVPCVLSPEQAALYQAAVDRALGSGLEGSSRMERRGRILALLTQLKQVCNHPAQFLREPANSAALSGRSGKLAAAREVIGEAVAGGDQVLVFTQYVEMGRLLVAAFSADLGVPIPFLHGGLPATARDRMVAGFQGEPAALDALDADRPPPVLIVSLRAGGTGLNLTAATHVLHYDRWWNPAVEDQATDRAHRIGQERTVEVHKLVTAGTVEERVAELLERKRALADAVVGAGETWITELGDDELAELVRLSGSAVAEIDDDVIDGAFEEAS